MKRFIVGLVFWAGFSWPLAAFAAEIRLPAQIEESEISVRQRFGEPLSVYFDDMTSTNMLSYQDRGFTVTVVASSGVVTSVSVLGNYHDPAAGTYTGGVVDELDMNTTLDRFVEKFGPGQPQGTFIDGATGYSWMLDNYILKITVWNEDHTEKGVMNPKGSILSAEILNPEYEI